MKDKYGDEIRPEPLLVRLVFVACGGFIAVALFLVVMNTPRHSTNQHEEIASGNCVGDVSNRGAGKDRGGSVSLPRHFPNGRGGGIHP